MEEVVYHGSKEKINEITAHKSTHQKECIYATPNKVVSLLFMGKGQGDLDTMIGVIDGELTLVERRPNILNDIYNIITVQAQSILRQIFPQPLPLRCRKSARIQPHPQFQQGIPLRPH